MSRDGSERYRDTPFETPERRSASAGADRPRHQRGLSRPTDHFLGVEFADQRAFEVPSLTAQTRSLDLASQPTDASSYHFAHDIHSMEMPTLSSMASAPSAPATFKSVHAPSTFLHHQHHHTEFFMSKPSLSSMTQPQTHLPEKHIYETMTPDQMEAAAQEAQANRTPPPAAPAFYEKSSSFKSDSEPADIVKSLCAALKGTGMVQGCEVDPTAWTIRGWAQLHHQTAAFCVFLYTLVTGNTLIEFQRRKGDTMTFVDLFQAAVLGADAINPKPIDAMHPLPVNAKKQQLREAATMAAAGELGMGMPSLGATARVPLSRATSSPFEDTIPIDGSLLATLLDMSLSAVFEPQREAIAAMARASEDAGNQQLLSEDQRILEALQAALKPSAFEILAPAMVCLSNLCCSSNVGASICQRLACNPELTHRLFELLSSAEKSHRAIAASAARIALQLSQGQADAIKDYHQVMTDVVETTDDPAIRHDTSMALHNVLGLAH